MRDGATFLVTMKQCSIAAVLLMLFAACGQNDSVDETKDVTPPNEGARRVVEAARARIGVTKLYDPAYVGLDYPGGDVPNDRGVCIDVVVRSLREMGIDLQKEVHEDMKANFAAYPQRWGLTKPDKNIDHRRVPNVACYFEREGYSLPVTNNSADYLPGDIVACTVGGNRPHIMVVSDKARIDGTPLIIHNIGSGTEEEDSLFYFPQTGHYRLWPTE